MGWIFPIMFTAMTLGGLKLSGRLNRTAFELAIVAGLIGLAGYAWQGAPSLGGSPILSAPNN
ncbi:MAG: hypothetical protein ABL918_00255 [Chakrabartia sp.]